MKPGDLILASSHSYPDGWKMGEKPYLYAKPTPVIFLSEFSEDDYGGRKFYVIIAPTGFHTINSAFCTRVS
jgi:hypothetical protein